MIHSPSKFSSISFLESIQADHFLSKSKEYSETEVRSLLMEKYQTEADRDIDQWAGVLETPKLVPNPPKPIVLPPPFRVSLLDLVNLEYNKGYL